MAISTARRRSGVGGVDVDVDEHPASSDLTPAFAMCVRSVEYGVPVLWGDEHAELHERERFIRYGDFRREEEEREEDGDGEGEVPVLSFMDDDDEMRDDERAEEEARRREEEEASGDRWLQEARILERSIREMSDLLKTKEASYSDLAAPLRLAGFQPSVSRGGEMSDAERSELQGAAVAFAAGAANRIEALRQSLPTPSRNNVHKLSDDVVAHRAGVLAILLARLRSDVADRIGRMNAARGRASLESYRRPFAVRMMPPPPSSSGGDDGLMDMDDAPAGKPPPMPSARAGTRSSRREAEARAFRAAYADNDDELAALLVPPKFAAPPRTKPRVEDERMEATATATDAPSKRQGTKLDAPAPTRPKLAAGGGGMPPPKAAPVHPAAAADPTLLERYGETPEERESYVEDLQRESAYLTAKLHSELDDVRKVEVRMTEITTLLGQFSDLVSEQQVNVIKVKETTERSKKNVEDGQEQLVKAAQSGKESKHRMATFIVVLTLVMLFLNYITP